MMLGSRFALLRPEFADLRTQALEKRARTGSIETVLVNFGGSGNNKIIVNNSLCSGACDTKGGSGVQAIQVKDGSATGSITIGSNPIKNTSLGTITYQGTNTALIQTGSSGKVNITAPAP